MNYFKYSIILFVFTGLTFLGCSDKSSGIITPAPGNFSTAPSLAKTSGSGAWIFRIQGEAYIVFYDANAGLFLTLGINDISSFCSDNGGLDVSYAQIVVIPYKGSELRRALEIVKGDDMSAYIWKVDSPPSPTFSGLCDFLSNNTPMASGKINLIFTDNDFYASTENYNNHNSFGYSGNGTLNDQNNQLYKLTLLDRIVWDGNNVDTRKETLRIQLKKE